MLAIKRPFCRPAQCLIKHFLSYFEKSPHELALFVLFSNLLFVLKVVWNFPDLSEKDNRERLTEPSKRQSGELDVAQ
jgi:hypothetical protein